MNRSTRIISAKLIVVMRKITALLMAVVTLFAFASCAYRVKNEDKAEKVYTCPSDNMYGLEKIVVFEDGITMVFNKRICDKSKHNEFDKMEPGDELYGKYMELRGKPYYYPHISNSLLVKSGKYVASAFYYSDNEKAICEEKKFVICGMQIYGKFIDINDGNIILSYEDWKTVTDGHLVIKQQYDASTGKWGEVEEEFFSTWSEG